MSDFSSAANPDVQLPRRRFAPPAAAHIDEGAVAAHAGADVGRGALDPCSGLILTWREGSASNQIDDGGCTEGD